MEWHHVTERVFSPVMITLVCKCCFAEPVKKKRGQISTKVWADWEETS